MDSLNPTALSKADPAPLALTVDWKSKVPTVSQVTRRLRGHLENAFFDVWVRGEISNYRKPASGHAYLVLKDAGAQLRTCLFRPVLSKLKFQIEDGMEVLVHGRISVYEARGEYQMVGDTVEPVGAGALQLAFEQLKSRLQQEGLFAADRKKPLPVLPRCIGVVTSQTGAAIHDILNVINRRFPQREILIFHAAVQGAAASREIVRALKLAESYNQANPPRPVEVLIVGRGGGSIEDLWCFNEENVARAMSLCEIPIISAVGHEVDFTIADFVADMRAPTPSAAAELVLPKYEDLALQVQSMERRLIQVLRGRLEQRKFHLAHLGRRLISPTERIARLRGDFEKMTRRLRTSMTQRLALTQARLKAASQKLDALSPLKTLGRGFTLARKTDGTLLRAAAQLSPGDRIRLRFADGSADAEVLSTQPIQG